MTITIFDGQDENENAHAVLDSIMGREVENCPTSETLDEWVARNVALVGEEETKRRLRAKVARHGG